MVKLSERIKVYEKISRNPGITLNELNKEYKNAEDIIKSLERRYQIKKIKEGYHPVSWRELIKQANISEKEVMDALRELKNKDKNKNGQV